MTPLDWKNLTLGSAHCNKGNEKYPVTVIQNMSFKVLCNRLKMEIWLTRQKRAVAISVANNELKLWQAYAYFSINPF